MRFKLKLAPLLMLLLAAEATTNNAFGANANLQGGWLQGSTQCAEVFSGAGKNLKFRKGNAFEAAFIIAGNQIRTPHAACRIKKIKPAGERRILTLSCETGISADEVPAILDQDRVDTSVGIRTRRTQ